MNEKIFAIFYFLAFGVGVGLVIDLGINAQEAEQSKYNIFYNDRNQVKNIEQTENEKGCILLHNSFTNDKKMEGVLTFTCDIIPPIIEIDPIEQRVINLEQRVNNLENNRVLP